MKKGLLASYLQGICDDSTNSESYFTIIRFFLPEFIAALTLYSALHLLDAHFIGSLKSIAMYSTLSVTNGLYHFIVKIAEGLSVGAVIICGQYNGAKRYADVGMAFVETFWMMVLIGFSFAIFLYGAAPAIYAWYGVTKEIAVIGVPFLRLRAIGVLFMFLYFGCIAFLRGIKNTKTPMYIYLIGGVVFIFFDYALIFGKFGLPALGFFGSAIAGVIQYGLMFVISVLILIFDKKYSQYAIKLLEPFKDLKLIKRFFALSWPIVLDKATMAGAYVWLGKMMATMGTTALATFAVVKDMDRVSFLPAIAFAQIITFLASNNFGSGNISSVKNNIKKVLFLANIGVAMFLIGFYLWRTTFIGWFDQKGEFTALASSVFPFLAPLVFCDVFQIILSGALRGVSDVRTVMITRLMVCSFLFVPGSYIVAHLPIASVQVKFILIYVTFYLSNAIMSAVYINRFRSNKWLKEEL